MCGIFLLKKKCTISLSALFVPAQKPLNLIDHFIEIASNPGDIVFDPFMGVGTTGVSSVKKGRRFIGSELNCDYVTAANKRIASYM